MKLTIGGISLNGLVMGMAVVLAAIAASSPFFA
jgi:hypothetical protein